jgi:hypothetical protein
MMATEYLVILTSGDHLTCKNNMPLEAVKEEYALSDRNMMPEELYHAIEQGLYLRAGLT